MNGTGKRRGFHKRNSVVVEDILGRVARGESLAAICSAAEYPTRESFRLWVKADADLAAKYLAAMQAGLTRRHSTQGA